MYKFFYSLLILIASSGYSQVKQRATINFVNLKDSVLVKELKSFLIEEKLKLTNDSITRPTKGAGYVNLLINQHFTGDTLVQYSIYQSYSDIAKNADDSFYPPYYTFIDKKLILIRFFGSELLDITYSEKSKKQLRKKIDKFLEKPKKAVFKDMEGNKVFTDKKFRVTWFNFHNGRHVYIIKNKAPVIVNE